WWPRGSSRTHWRVPRGDRQVRGHPKWYRAEPFGLSGEVKAGEPFEQDSDRDLAVEACEWRAEAEVSACAEREVRVRFASDVEGVGIGKGGGVAVCAGREDHAPLASGQLVAVDLDVAAGACQHDAHR